MIIPKLNRNQAEKIFMSVTNVGAATITTGLPVGLAIGASCDGVNAVNANAAAAYPGFIGIAIKDIAVNDYGLVQIAGFVNSVYLSNVGTSLTINAGDPLVPAPAGMFSGAPTYANSGFRMVFASNVPPAVSAASYASGLIRMI